MFSSPFGDSILKRAKENGLIDIHLHDLRTHSTNKHKKVDDYPFGGGAGMVMNVEPIARALKDVEVKMGATHKILLSPSGSLFDGAKAKEFAERKAITLVCGRYEGVDERVRHYVDEEISIGDFVLSGGEIAAMVVVDAVSRLIPGVLGDEASLLEESFSEGLLEYPQYTRPREFDGHSVPDVLISGDHKKIKQWQRQKALIKTAKNRPDLLENTTLTDEDKKTIDQVDFDRNK